MIKIVPSIYKANLSINKKLYLFKNIIKHEF